MELASQFQVETVLAPILEFVPPGPGKVDDTPSKEQVLAAHKLASKTNTGLPAQNRRKTIGASQISVESNKSPSETAKRGRKPTNNTDVSQYMQIHPEISSNNSGSQHFTSNSKKSKITASESLTSTQKEKYRAALMAMFLSDNPLAIPDFLVNIEAPNDLDTNIIIDDQGHSAIHWAAALARIDILRLLIGKGGDVMAVNYNAESALIRSVLVTNNFDSQSFPQLLKILSPSLELTDHNKRSVLHHIALVCRFEIF